MNTINYVMRFVFSVLSVASLILCWQLNQVFSQTVFPLCPCMLVHFCLPFSHICVIFYYESKRREGVRQVLDSFNKRVLSERGAYYL